MIGPNENRSDFVLGMTLAEVFLLLLFVVWLATAIERSADGQPDATVEAVTLKATVARLEERVKMLDEDNRGLTLRLEQVREMLGAPNATEDELRGGLKRKLDEAKRGSPVCDVANIVAHVALIEGVESLTVKRNTIGFLPDGRWADGAALHAIADIEAFRASVRRYYKERKGNCRFDYRLQYKTDADYRLGRTRYESDLFYNAGLQRQP